MLSVCLPPAGTIFAYGQTGTGKTYTMEGVCCCVPLVFHTAGVYHTCRCPPNTHLPGCISSPPPFIPSLPSFFLSPSFLLLHPPFFLNPPSFSPPSLLLPLSPLTGVRSKPEERGVIPNSFEHIFTHIARTHDEQYLVRVSYLEIYQVRKDGGGP